MVLREEGKKKKKRGKKYIFENAVVDEYGEEIEDQEVDYGDRAEDVIALDDDVVNDDGEIVVVGPGGAKEKYEKGTDYELKKVKTQIDAKFSRLADKFGFPIITEKLVPIEVQQRVYEYETQYEGVRRMKRGPFGLYFVEKGPMKTLKKIGEDLPPRSSTFYENNSSYEIARVVEKKNTYHEGLDFGALVKHYEEDAIVVGFNKDGVQIAFIASGDRDFVYYDDGNLKIVAKSSRKPKIDKDVVVTVHDFYPLPVSDKLREFVVQRYIDAFDLIRKNIIANTEQKPLTRPPPLTPFDYYHQVELRKWYYAYIHQQLLDNLDLEAINRRVEEEMQQQTDIPGYIKRWGSLFADHDLFAHSSRELAQALRKYKEITVADAMLLSDLERETKDLEGTDLAMLISQALEKYFRLHPVDQGVLIRKFVDQAIVREFASTTVPQADRDVFEATYGEEVRKLYEDYKSRYLVDLRTYEAQQEEYEKISAELAVGEGAFENRRVERSAFIDGIRDFERTIYGSAGGSTVSYLQEVMMPYVFLVGTLSKNARFFRAKVAAGDFPTSRFASMNIAHFLPEISTNEHLTVTEWKEIGEIITIHLFEEINMVISFFETMSRPSQKNFYQERIDMPELKRFLISLTNAYTTKKTIVESDIDGLLPRYVLKGYRLVPTKPNLKEIIVKQWPKSIPKGYKIIPLVEDVSLPAKEQKTSTPVGIKIITPIGVTSTKALDKWLKTAPKGIKLTKTDKSSYSLKIKNADKKVLVELRNWVREPPSGFHAVLQFEKITKSQSQSETKPSTCGASGYRYKVDGGKYVYQNGEKVLEEIPEEDLVICYDREQRKYSCHSLPEILVSFRKGNYLNPHTGQDFTEKFVKKITKIYTNYKMNEPQDVKPEPSPSPSSPSPSSSQTIEEKSEIESDVIERPIRVRPLSAGTKKKKIVKIEAIALKGDVFRVITMFDDELVFNLGDDETRSISLKKPSKANVVVLAFDATNPKSIKTLKYKPDEDQRVYVYGYNAQNIKSIDKMTYAYQVKKQLNNKVEVFYMNFPDEEEIRDALGDILVDMEGLSVE